MFVGNIVLLKELFLLIDENYELNIFDEEKIDDLNKKKSVMGIGHRMKGLKRWGAEGCGGNFRKNKA